MPEAIGFILGFDPGGADRFGWSVCSAGADRLQRPLKTGLADDAWDALNTGEARQSRAPDLPGRIHQVLAAGIDAPLSSLGQEKE